MKRVIKDFQKYTETGHRVAAFATENIKGNIMIFLLFCNPKDHFRKKTADKVYEQWGIDSSSIRTHFHPKIIHLPLEEGNSVGYTFGKYMRENFYKKVSTIEKVGAKIDYLYKPNNRIVLDKQLTNKIYE